MALIQTVYAGELYEIACRMGRGEYFGCKGWQALGEYIESLSDDIGQDIEVDVISICCDYSMVESVDDFVSEFQEFMDYVDPEEWDEMPEDEKLDCINEYLQEKTSVVICENDCIIWQVF